MSSLSGESRGGLDSKFYAPLLVAAMILLIFTALSLGAVAVLVVTNQPSGSHVDVSEVSTSVSTTTTTTTTVRSTTTTATTPTLQEGPTTTFLEYFATTTTLSEVQLPEEESSCSSKGYRGPYACKAKNLAWFDQWV